MPTRSALRRPAGLLLAALLLAGPAAAQDRAARLPDGTVILYSKTPDDPAARPDGVLLSPKEYQSLLDQLDAARGAKEAARPTPPTACHLTAKIDPRADRPTAALTAKYTFRTVAAKQLVPLGLARAFLLAAAAGDGKPPLLEQTADGWAALVEVPGEHTLTLDAETAVTPRGAKAEVGFDVGLPRAAITTLALEPWAGAGRVSVTTRTPEPGGPARSARSSDPIGRYSGNGQPLGPVEAVEVAWDAPAAAPQAPTAAAASADADIAVRVDETSVETSIKLRLRDGPRDWSFALPSGFEPAFSRPTTLPPVTEATLAPLPEITRPADAAKPVWKVRFPEAGGEWLLSAVARQSRTGTGPIRVGPFVAVGVPRQSGTIRLFAPVGVRLSDFQHPREVRRQDAPGSGDDPPVAVFRYPNLTDAGGSAPLLTCTAGPAVGLVAVQPVHRLTLTPGGWRLRADVRVTPIRRTVESLEIDLPAGWEETVVRPFELVEEVQTARTPAGGQTLTVKLAGGRKEAFPLIVESRFPVPDTAARAAVPLPRFPKAVEREAKLTAAVADGFEVKGTGTEWAAKGTGPTVELKPTPGGPAGQITAAADGGFAAVELAWAVYQPPLTADLSADVTITDRQAQITQTIRVKSNDPIARPVRLRGPATAAGFRSRPEATPVGPGEWTVTPPAGAKEFTLAVSYAVPLPPRAADGSAVKAGVPLVWPDASRADAEVRVWAADAGGRRPTRFDGPWRELPPKPADDRDALPGLTLDGTAAGGPLPLDLLLSDPADPATGGPVVERAAVQAWAADDGTVQVRGRFLLKRWASGLDLEVVSAGPPTVFADRVRLDTVTPLPAIDDTEARVYRVSLPDPKPGRPPLPLEVRYFLPPRPGAPLELVPPRVRGAAYRSPVWWQVGVPQSGVPLLPAGLSAEVWWKWREPVFAPTAAGTPADLDRWLADGSEPADAAAAFDPPPAAEVSVTFRQPAPAAVRVRRVPRPAWVIGWSGLAVAAAVGLSRLRGMSLGLAVAGLGLVAAAGAAVWPQPAGQAAAAIQPGLLAAAVLLLGQAAVRWLHVRRQAKRTGFVRSTAGRSDSGRTTASGTGSHRPPPVPSSAS